MSCSPPGNVPLDQNVPATVRRADRGRTPNTPCGYERESACPGEARCLQQVWWRTGRLPDIEYARHADRVTRVDAELTIRPSAVRLVVMVAWILFLCMVVVIGAVNQHDPRGLLLVLIWLPWLVPVALLSTSRLRVVGEVLTLRGAVVADQG
jgi:hypothetical protein